MNENNPEHKQFDLGVLLSMTTGYLFCEFSKMHEAAEFVMGHPIWSHEFGMRETVDKLRSAVLLQHPDLIGIQPRRGDIRKDNWRSWLAQTKLSHGPETRTVTKGNQDRATVQERKG